MINKKYFTEFGEQFLLVESDFLDEYISFINNETIKSICLNSSFGYKLKNTLFLQKCPKIEKIFIVDDDINIEGVLQNFDLKFLSSSSMVNNKVDFIHFKKLIYLAIDYSSKLLNINKLTQLEELRIWKLKDINFFSQSLLYSLRKLDIIQGNLNNIEDIERVSCLEELDLHHLSKLQKIIFTKPLHKLRRIFIDSCKNIVEVGGLENLPNLEMLTITNCKQIPTCIFLNKALPSLKRVSISYTKILDGSENLITRFHEYSYGGDKPIIANFSS